MDKGNRPDQTLALHVPSDVAAEELEIIELEDRLDMTVDPLVFALGPLTTPPNTNCHNFFCCV